MLFEDGIGFHENIMNVFPRLSHDIEYKVRNAEGPTEQPTERRRSLWVRKSGKTERGVRREAPGGIYGVRDNVDSGCRTSGRQWVVREEQA